MGKGYNMGERRLLNEMRCVVLLSLTFSGKDNVRYFDHAGLRKTVDIVGKKRGNMK